MKKTMKKSLILSLVVAAATSLSAMAETINIIPGYGPYQTGNGGEITVVPVGFGISGYVPGVTSGLAVSGSFQTFCLELHESLINGTFTAVPNDVTKLTGFTLNKGVAWLYEQFAAGTLAGYDYTAAGRKTSAGLLQQEIWYLMGGQAPASSFDAIVNAAALQGGWNPLDANDSDFSNVSLLNVWTPGMVDQREGAKQDLLYIPGTAVPDGGLTLALLGMGLTGLGFVSRRIRK